MQMFNNNFSFADVSNTSIQGPVLHSKTVIVWQMKRVLEGNLFSN